MTRINIIGLGVLDFDERTDISFKKSNVQYNWANMEVGRSTEFSVPATPYNRMLLGFAEDNAEWGEAMRKRHDCEMQYSGGVCKARLSVTRYDGRRFVCVLYYPHSEDLDKLDGKQLKDCLCTLQPLLWDGANVLQANNPSLPSTAVALVEYDGSYLRDGAQRPDWTYMPSVSVKLYIEDILDNLVVRHDLDIPATLRMVAPTLHGGSFVAGHVAKTTSGSAGTIDQQLQTFFEWVNDATIKWWSGYFGIGHTAVCPSLRPKVDVEVTFRNDFPANVQLMHRNGNTYTPVTDRWRDANGVWHGEPLAGRTVTLKAGMDFWFVDDIFMHYDPQDGYYTGWKADMSPFDYMLSVGRSGDIAIGEYWSMADNAPDMTVVEFLRSVALVLGKELYYDFDNDKVVMASTDVGSEQRTALDNVTGIDSLTRNVADWGDDDVLEVVRFDSEDYVRQPLTGEYRIINGTLGTTSEHVSKFSEGDASDITNGAVLILDTEFGGQEPKVTAKRWTVALSGQGKVLLRAGLSPYDANGTIASLSTCMVVKVVMDLFDYITMDRGAVFTWRGSAFVWTSASWTDGVATLTLQRY